MMVEAENVEDNYQIDFIIKPDANLGLDGSQELQESSELQHSRNQNPQINN